jgi:trimeric autotransporter adhesin
MATTDARAGFRLPWSSDRPSSENPDGESTESAAAATAWPSEDTASRAASATSPDATATEPAGSADLGSGPVAPRPSGKRPSKFMADLTKAMQAAAEEARGRTLSQLQADAKSHVETIHGRSATEAANLRRKADDDVAAVREWSKVEIARIREETETRISDRKLRLESEIEDHAAVIEREIDTVQKAVAAFESEMAHFFERLLVEEDPTRFATMAENLPEAPTFASLLGMSDDSSAEPSDAATVTMAAETDATATAAELDREAAMAAIQAAAEAAASATVAADAAARAEAVADVAIEIMGNHEEGEADADPRLAALALEPDFAAAEAEALTDAEASDEDVPEIADEAVAARLAGLAPAKGAGDATATQVVVVGLVSVASIASFKRHLGRVAGVQSVGVSSGPEGEFVFAVNHGAGVVRRDVIAGLPTFQARVTGSADGVVHVTAHDPESDG